jgi:site-specific DNA recombinase
VILEGEWEQLAPAEQADVIRRLVERVAYDGEEGKVAITFRPAGLVALSTEEEPQ